MKQKLVMEVSMINGRKSQIKAMKIAATAPGVESVALQGDEKNQIVVTGDGIDSIVLIKLIRKNVGYTKLETIAPVDEKESKKKETESEEIVQPIVWSSTYAYQYGVPQISVSEVRDHYNCTIM